MPYRGDTENHWLLYYTSLYLMAQMYPDQPGDTWFTGKSSAENMADARQQLDQTRNDVRKASEALEQG